MALLEAKDMHAGYGGANILNGVSIEIEADQIGVIVGPTEKSEPGMSRAPSPRALWCTETITRVTVFLPILDVGSALVPSIYRYSLFVVQTAPCQGSGVDTYHPTHVLQRARHHGLGCISCLDCTIAPR